MKNFNFERVIRVVLHHIWIVILFTLLGAAVTFAFRPNPHLTQTASAQFVVSPKRQYDVSNGTLLDLVKTSSVLGRAVRDYNQTVQTKADKVSYVALSAQDSGLQVTMTGNSRVVTVTATAEAAKDVKTLVNLIAERAVKVALQTLPAQSGSVITPAYLSKKSSGGLSAKKAIILGAAVGFVVGVEGAIIYDSLKRRHLK